MSEHKKLEVGSSHQVIQTDTVSLSEMDDRQRILGVIQRSVQIAQTEDLGDLTDQMLDLMISVSEAEMGLLYLLDGVSDELVIISGRGEIINPSFTGLRFNKTLGIVGTVVGNQQPVIIGDLVDTQHWLQAIDPAFASGLRNVITLPMDLNGDMVGAIQLFNYQGAEIDLLEVLTATLTAEINRTVILKRTQHANQKLKNVIDTLQDVAGNLDRDRLLHLVTEQAALLLNAERSSVFLADSDDAELNFQVSYRASEQGSARGRVSQEGKITDLIQSVKPDTGMLKLEDRTASKPDGAFGFTTRSAISVPLQSQSTHEKGGQNQTYGGLMVVNKMDGDFSPEDAQFLTILGTHTSKFLEITDLFESANDLFLGIVKSMVTAIDAKDPYTQGHSLRVSEVSVAISEELGLTDQEVNDIRVGSLLHDIGKIGIPDHILKKKYSLTSKEYDEVKKHPVVGQKIMRQARALQPLLPAIISHHERLDGSGYPYGLQGDEIPLMSRIVAVADIFDAMASERPYREAIPVPDVLEHLENAAGTELDSDCVAALIHAVKTNRIQ